MEMEMCKDTARLVKPTGKSIYAAIETSFLLTSEEQIEEFIKAIYSARRIGISGAGRSSIAAKAFVVRMINLGFDIFFIGELVSKPLTRDDLAIFVSGAAKHQA